MQLVIPFPDISPELFTIDLGPVSFALRWYALAYITGIIIGWRIAVRAMRTPRLWPGDTPPMTPSMIEDFLTWIILGIILGGRLGFVLFYQPEYYLANPLQIPALWKGGMSFHGGFLGVLVAGLLFCRKYKLPILSVADTLAIATAPGLMLGRIANFINNELWGRPSTLPWAVIFPGTRAQDCPGVVGLCARHPSQLYEAGLEGLLLGGILLFLAWRRDWLKLPGQTMGLFVAGYGVARFFVEFFRQADPQFITPANPMGNVVQWGGVGISMGQVLSLPMILVGLWFIAYARRTSRVTP